MDDDVVTSPRHFLTKLQQGEVIPPVRAIGMVKAEDGNADNILYSSDCGEWTTIPIDLIAKI
ncbi:hypothetical protein ACH4SK_13810 [Streptomyces inhibens]|uniref:hypothetical protein n=1 Tax=Streptomyces inhibens TaxID=2293571 RepID=UPI0037BBE195